MKNLMIYVSPTGSFNNPRPGLTNDAGQLVKVQIENSLSLGWNVEDILLFTNFDYQYGSIKAKVLKDVKFFERKPQASKINAIVELFDQGMIQDNELYWFHDLDAYQLQSITESELGLGSKDMALTDYGVLPRWSTGIIYFKKNSRDIFEKIQGVMYQHNINEELALTRLTRSDANIAARIKKLNKSYNFTPPKLKLQYSKAIKPLRVAHFHIIGGDGRFEVKNPVAFFKGENELNIPLITERLIKIFKYHRIRADVNVSITGSVAIFIPTYKRAHKLLAVYKNAKNSSPLISSVYFIVEKEDQESINVLKTNHLPYFINQRSKNYAGALNSAYLKTSEKYFFNGADDLDFKPGWLEKCLEKMVEPVKVVGTNDLHNGDVLRGRHSTHSLIDRDYIKIQSGIFDEENLVFSESYLHNWVDREFVELAKFRGVFASCLEAIVEHLHWRTGLSPRDETYDLQNHTGNHDLRNYLHRRSVWSK